MTFFFATEIYCFLCRYAGISATPVTSLEQIIQNMQQIKAAATAANPTPSLNPAPTKPPRAPLPFTPTDPSSSTPAQPRTRPAADSPNATSASQHTASKAVNVDKQASSGLIAPDSLPSRAQEAFDQQTGNDGKSSLPSGALATASSSSSAAAAAAAAASGSAGKQAATLEVNQPDAEELMGADHPQQTASISRRAVEEDQGMLQSSPASQARTEQPGQEGRASAGVPTESVKLDSSSSRVKKSSRGNLEKKSNRESKRDADRKPSRAKRRRSKSRSQSDSPKR